MDHPPAPEESPAGGSEDDEKTSLDDDRTDRVVDDIIAHEGDEVLEAEDAAAIQAGMPTPKRGFWGSIGHFFGRWFGTSQGRWLTFFGLVLASAIVIATAPARYWVLNTAGAQASASVTVVDELTQLPLKGVDVTLGNHTQQTAADGRAQFAKLRLGNTQLSVMQPGFASVQEGVTIGWGSNPFGPFALKATGARYAILIRDYLSEKPLADVLATSGQATALSDDKGKIILTLDSLEAAQAPVTLSKDGYRLERITLKSAKQSTTAAMVPARKTVFITKESGRYDLYKSDIDGANRELLLRATGSENGTNSLVASPDGTHAALVSTRDNQQNTLTLLTVADNTATTLAHAEQLQLIDWIGTRLIFQQVSADPSTPAASRYGIISYDYATNSRVQLAAAPRLNAVWSAQGAIYYAVAVSDNNGPLQPGLYRISPDGNGRQRVIEQEVLSGLRADYRTLALQTAGGWLAYDIAGNTHRAVSGPESAIGRLYTDKADHTRSIWVNQGVLVNYDVSADKDIPLQTQSGLSYPLHWFTDDAVIYRVVTNEETADYVKSLLGGPAHKISDVSNSSGFTAGH